MSTPPNFTASLLLCCLLFSSGFLPQASATQTNIPPAPDRATRPIFQSLADQPLLFVHNDGQLDAKVKYYERGANHATYFTADGIYLSLFQQQKNATQPTPSSARSDQVKLSLVNAADNPRITAQDVQTTKYNYYIGNDPAKWHEGIATCGVVKYTEIYKNIDLKVYGNNHQLEYDIIIKPGGDPAAVKFKYEGADSLAINAEGELEIKLAHSTLIQKSPSLYQEISGQRVEVAGHFKLLADNSYTFSIAAYDQTKTLIIDPVIEYSKYLAGDGNDWGNSVAVDAAGNAYVTGKTDSTYFPVDILEYQHDADTYGNDIFVYKIDPSGARVYVTVFGGTAHDWVTGATPESGYDIAVDSSGYAHITGPTHSNDFPVWGGALDSLPFQQYNGADSHDGYTTAYTTDAFYVALNGNGSRVYSSYIGGANWERGNSIAVDDSGNIYIAGKTAPYHYNHPSDFPVAGTNILQSTYGGDPDTSDTIYPADAFITKIHFDVTTPANTTLVFSTYFGGLGNDEAKGITVDDSGNIYITGTTNSTNLPGASASPIQSMFAGGVDAFAAKINTAGTAIIYSTYLGGNRNDFGNAIAVDAEGCAYIAGFFMPPPSGPYNFPLINSVQNIPGGGEYDAFATKINAAGTAIDYSTFLGGALTDKALDIAVDSHGSAFIAGETWSANFPVENYLAGHGAIHGDDGREADGFITRLSPLGSTFIYSTFLGGDGDDIIGNDNAGTDSIHGIAIDDNGNAWVTGMTTSHSFPGPNGYINDYDTYADGFISKISDDSVMPPEVSSVSPLAGATNVLISSSPISASFNRDMAINTFAGHISLVPAGGGDPVAGTVDSNGGRIIEFTPLSNLAYETMYTATVTTGVTDVDGNPLPADYSWEFTTESAAPDTTPPTVISTTPATSDYDYDNRVKNVPVNTVVTVTFSEPMKQDTITSDNLYLRDSSWNRYNGSVTYNPATMIATIDVSLPYGIDLDLMVLYQVADQAGNPMGNTYDGWFTTECDPDAPTLISSYPEQYATGIPVNVELTFTFSTDMDPATLDVFGVSVYRWYPYSPIDGSFSYDAGSRTLTFTPSAPLPVGAWIAALFRETVTDTTGRHLCYPSEDEPVYVVFATADSDGVTDQEEQGPDGNDSNYDGNGDGYADWTQANVTSLHSNDGSKYVTLSCPEGQLLENIAAESNPSAGDSPGGVAFPVGFYNFTITGLEPGGATTLTLNLPDGETVNSYWKYGPTPDDTSNHWYNFMYDEATATGAVINGSEIVLHFVDGQRGDDDLTADAKIIEPGAPGFIDNTFDFDDDSDVDGDDLAEFASRLDTGTASIAEVEAFAAAYGR